MLRVLSLVFRSLTVFVRHLLPISAIAILPLIAAEFTFGAILPFAIGAAASLAFDLPSYVVLGSTIGLYFVTLLVFCSVPAAWIAQYVHDSQTTKRAGLGSSFAYVAPSLARIAALSVMSSVLIVLAGAAFVVPAIYVMACWATAIPAAAIERRGVSALSRSYQLTANYRIRWSILIALFSLGAITIAIQLVTSALVTSDDFWWVPVAIAGCTRLLLVGWVSTFSTLLFLDLRSTAATPLGS